jgi:acetyl esterase/lipase
MKAIFPRLVRAVCSLIIVLGVAHFATRGMADDAASGAAKNVGSESKPVTLWPGVAPGDKGDIGPEHDSTKHNPKGEPSKEVIRLANVSKPTITVFSPPKDQNTGAAVVVCPGGGYAILAYDLEGTEICHWLNSIGVTGVLLKYRVPARPGRERFAAPLEDAQRAIGMVRSQAKDWGIDPKRIGILGFSAGGHLAATSSTNFSERTYPTVDAADRESCRPDFTILIYPAYLAEKGNPTKLAPEIKVGADTPPAFIAMTEDDAADNAVAYFLALRHLKIPCEMHIYPKGGHGYGLRPSPNEVSHWPDRAAEWLKANGWLAAK